jgi:hypothetical protein
MRQALGATEIGQPVDTQGLTGRVEQIGPVEVLVRLSGPVPGYIGFFVMDKGNGMVTASVGGYLFSDEAAAFVERERPSWKAWLARLAVPAA